MPQNYLATLVQALRSRYRSRWITTLLFVLLVTGVAMAIAPTRVPDEFFDYTSTIVVSALAGLLFLFSFFIEPFVLTHKRISEIIDAPHDLYYLTAHAQSGAINHALHDELEKLTDDELNQYTLFHVSSRAMGITWILGSCIALLGLVLLLTTPCWWIYLPYSSAALIILMLHHPKWKTITSRFHKTKLKRK